MAGQYQKDTSQAAGPGRADVWPGGRAVAHESYMYVYNNPNVYAFVSVSMLLSDWNIFKKSLFPENRPWESWNQDQIEHFSQIGLPGQIAMLTRCVSKLFVETCSLFSEIFHCFAETVGKAPNGSLARMSTGTFMV